MYTAVAFVPRSPGTCWRVFTDATMFPAWIPGLRKARVITTDEHGRPREILFEFSASLTYSLVYTYDEHAHVVRWEPQLGRRDAVRGSARFEALDDGTQMTYELEPCVRSADRGGADVDAVVAAFVTWVNAQRPTLR